MVIHSATAAYRADLASRAEPFGPHDGGWIAVANLLEQAALLPPEQRDRLLTHAIDLARQLVEESAFLGSTTPEWGATEPGRGDPIVLLADAVFQAGALHLARAMLQALLDADATLTALQRGRLVARRGRVDARRGHLEEAANQYEQLEREGKRLGLPELQVRAWIGLAAVAQMHGNYPEAERWSRRAARLADRMGLRRLSQQAHTGLMIAAGTRHRFDVALEHARIAWQAAVGDSMNEAEILLNVGQLLLVAGHLTFATQVFGNLLRRPLPIRFILPALGGLAVSSGAAGEPARVLWAAAELERLRLTSGIPPYHVAITALECAEGLSLVGRMADAGRMLELAVSTAEAHAFYEVIVKADAVRARTEVRSRSQRPLGPAASRLAREIGAGTPERLPDHVLLAAAP